MEDGLASFKKVVSAIIVSPRVNLERNDTMICSYPKGAIYVTSANMCDFSLNRQTPLQFAGKLQMSF